MKVILMKSLQILGLICEQFSPAGELPQIFIIYMSTFWHKFSMLGYLSCYLSDYSKCSFAKFANCDVFEYFQQN